MSGIIDNRDIRLEDVIKEGLKDDRLIKFRVAVGYFFSSGLKVVFPELKAFMDGGGKTHILIGNWVNRETQEDLIKVYKDLDMVEKAQPNHLIESKELDDLSAEAKEDLKKQILYTLPTPENEEYFSLLRKWIEEDQFELRIYVRERFHAKAYVFETSCGQSSVTRPPLSGIVGSSNFTLSGLISNTELNAGVYTQDAEALREWYENRWGEARPFSDELLKILKDSWVSYLPGDLPAPYYVYLKAIYELFKESLKTTDEILRGYRVYGDLYDFQKWAVLRAVQISNKYKGVMVSDIVGFGKTYIGAALMDHFYQRNCSLGRRGKGLVICPPKLEKMWEQVKQKYSLHMDIVSMGMLVKPDYSANLLEEHGDATVVLIDESHHFRNRGTNRYNNIIRYLPLANEVILLSATPYTRSPDDVYNQIKLFHPEDLTPIPINPPNLKEFIKMVDKKQASLSELLTHVMVRRTRYDIVNQYGGKDEDGREYIEIDGEKKYLPERSLKTKSYSIEDVYGSGLYDEIVDTLTSLNYARYALGSEKYLKPQYRNERKYQDLSTMGANLRGLMKVLLLKRLESSIPSFRKTLKKLLTSHDNFYSLLEEGVIAIGERIDELLREEDDLERIRDEIEVRREEHKIEKYEIDAFFVDVLKNDLKFDIKRLNELCRKIDEIYKDIVCDYTKDDKLTELCKLLNSLYTGNSEYVEGNIKKVLVFSEYIDTINHIEKGIEWMQKNQNYLSDTRIKMVTSNTGNVNEIVERFAPKANEAEYKYPKDKEIDILVATDVLGEGLNLQDANVVINYDIHWNPLRLIQRIGRVDRLGTKHEKVHVFNFLPEKTLETELKIVEKVGTRISEINDVLGMDAKVLTEDERPNRSFMESIYKEEIDGIEEFERDVLLGTDTVSGSVSELTRLMERNPELMEKIKGFDGIRSAKHWDGDNDAVFVLCRAGDYVTPYLIEFYGDSPKIMSSAQEIVLDKIRCDPEEKVADIPKDLFRERYSVASKIARDNFQEEIKKREKLVVPQSSKARSYVERELRKYAKRIEDPEQKRTIDHYKNIIHHISIPQVLDEFKDIEKQAIVEDQIFIAVESLIAKYNLEEKYERKQIMKEALKEPPHILCGMYLKGSG